MKELQLLMMELLHNRRGSLTIDDEGTPTEKTVLIENGILKNFMQDRLNARLMNTKIYRKWKKRKLQACSSPYE